MSIEREQIETRFSFQYCLSLEQALKYEFPNIKNLEVEMDEKGTCHVMFEETEYSEEQVNAFLKGLTNMKFGG